jgi:hypothetical protein
MSYLSLYFAAFVFAMLVGYYLLPKKVRWLLLLAGSMFFYACFDWKYLPFCCFLP